MNSKAKLKRLEDERRSLNKLNNLLGEMMDLPMVLAMAVQSVGVGGDVLDIKLDLFVMVVMLGAQSVVLVIIPVI